MIDNQGQNHSFVVGRNIELSQTDFNRLVDFMYKKYGIDLQKKYALVKGRLSTSLQKKGFADFKSYIDFVLNDRTEAEIPFLVSKLTTNYTYFLREKKHYDFMTKKALPEFSSAINNDLRIWSAGCSSGEEPYSIAMVLDDYFALKNSRMNKSILASDISEKVLNIAKTGVYKKESLNNIPDSFAKKYFTKEDEDMFKIIPKLKEQVTFKKVNLMDSFNFNKKFHIIFCRNVMIYFDLKTRNEVVNKFYDQLCEGGYLFIGLSETLANVDSKFNYVEPSIYKK